MSQSEQNQNIHFLGVGRVAGQGIVIADYSYKSKTDITGVKQVLEQPNMQLSPGKHYRFVTGHLAWHLISGNLWSIVTWYISEEYHRKWNIFYDLNIL